MYTSPFLFLSLPLHFLSHHFISFHTLLHHYPVFAPKMAKTFQILLSMMLLHLIYASTAKAARLTVTNKEQIECTLCDACENPCQPPITYASPPPPPTPSPPPPTPTNDCPPPPSQSTPTYYYSPPPPSNNPTPTYTYSSPPPPGQAIGGLAKPPPNGYSLYPGPPPPNPIVPYFPFYYHAPPPPQFSSANLIAIKNCFSLISIVSVTICYF
ncbi:pollen-specific leucine-rich repeat extensin-like protein 3 [Papaver somniferum]|uniref:pollen-specific leucine-rich repeat extensin-like protein 3 n=1 Tax=Papaver somniferum TaxID=3469 RepID=UPI000E705A47|nr:pollen-specific leucine-rich repeat extensin-like protein 3 [Papaver somniferum]